MQPQNLKNHTRIPPKPFMIVLIMAFAVIVIAAVNMCSGSCSSESCPDSNCYSLIIISLTIILAAFTCRRFAIVAQDRAIRAEENLRHFALTGKLLDKQLKLSQIIALRFASDEEFVDLAQRAVKENLSNKQIKEAIQNWRGDYHRV